MKKTFFVINIILIALAINKASAQDFEPTQIKVKYGQDSIYINANDERFKENKFMLGWHWGIHRYMQKLIGNVIIYGEGKKER